MEDRVVIEQYYQLRSCRAVAELYQCNGETIRRILKANGVELTGWKQTPEHALPPKKYHYKRDYKKQYIPVSYQVICQCCGKQFIAHDSRKKYCSRKCRDVAYRQSKGQDSRLETRQMKCIVCGKEFETNNANKKTCSPECSKENRQRYNNKRIRYGRARKPGQFSWDDYNKQRKEKAKQNKEKKEIEKVWYRAIHTVSRECIICGSLFYCLDKETKVTCSHECSKEYARRKRNKYHDKRLNKHNIVDNDISLMKLYKRDKGICYICGCVCDTNDYTVRDGVKICGKKYPSIEHVIPLSRGGKHQWENVRLACLSCNVKKGDVTPEYTKEMSREYARKYASEICKNKKKTAQYTLDGDLIKIWDSTAQIHRELGFNDKHIQNVCRGDNSNTGNAYGYHWEYVI